MAASRRGNAMAGEESRLYDAPEVCATYFFPQPHAPLPIVDRASPRDLHLPDDTRIGGYWCRPLAGAPTILYLHGNGERIADQLGHWPVWARQAGANIFFVDYPCLWSTHWRPSRASR